ncbi:MAG: hypothetical protein WBQ94_04285 [Terracidiphilus sp.]
MATAPMFDMSKAVPVAPPQTGGAPLFDMSKAVPVSGAAAPVQAPPAKPQPAQDAMLSDLTSNPKGEGTYQMAGPQGVVAVPFSKVRRTVGNGGYKFANHDEVARYAKDYHAAPTVAWNDLLEGVEEQPGWRHWLDPSVILADQTAGGLKGVATTVQGGRKLLGVEPKQPDMVAAMANRPNQNIQEGIGEMQENAGEFVTGQELLGLVGSGLKGSEALQEAGKVGQFLEKYPQIARVLRVGMNAVKNVPELGQALLGAGQTYIKTGGDTGAAVRAGLETGAAGAVTRVAGAGASALKTAIKGPEAAAGAGAAEYAAEARGAARPALEGMNEANRVPQQEVMMNQPGGKPAVPSGTRVATATGKAAPPQIDVNKVLSQVHDFTGASERLAEHFDGAYEQFDAASGGRFRSLNAEVENARRAMVSGQEGGAALYKSKLAEMDGLMDKTGGEMTPEMKAAAKAGWRQSYTLKSFGDIWDRNMNGVPGDSQASQTQRGINGKGLMKDLQRAVKDHGRGAVDDALGPGGLRNLEAIAEANQTAAQRLGFNRGVWDVVKHLHHGAVLGGTAGGMAGSWQAGAAIGTGVAAGAEAYSAVMNALKTNPKIAQNFLFALESGATPEKYGPFIATMIQKTNTDASRERQQQEQQ